MTSGLVLGLLVWLVASPMLAQAGGKMPLVVEIPSIELGPDETLLISYSGAKTVILEYNISAPATVVSERRTDSSGTSGVLVVALAKALGSDVGKLTVLFWSEAEFLVRMVIEDEEGGRLLGSYFCPGNVSVKFLMSLVRGGVERGGQTGARGGSSFRVVDPPPWRWLLYGVVLSSFTLTWALDAREHRNSKGRMWGVENSIALLIRYLVHASLLILVLTVIGVLMYAALTGVLYGTILVHIGFLLEAGTLTAFVSILYALAKWRGWYEVVDEGWG